MTDSAERLEREAWEVECRAAYEAEFYAGMSHPSEWSKETTEAAEWCWRLFKQGWQAARRAPAEAGARSERASWFSLVMGAAASLEDAANHLRDQDAQRIAMHAAEHYRERANALLAAAPAAPKQEPHRHAWSFFTLDNTYRCRCGATTMEKPC